MSDAGKVLEREWTDKFGDHFEVRAQGRSGKIYSQVVIKRAFDGWGGLREAARAAVAQALAGDAA